MATKGYVRQNLNDSLRAFICVCVREAERVHGHMQQDLLYFNSPFEMIVAD